MQTLRGRPQHLRYPGSEISRNPSHFEDLGWHLFCFFRGHPSFAASPASLPRLVGPRGRETRGDKGAGRFSQLPKASRKHPGPAGQLFQGWHLGKCLISNMLDSEILEAGCLPAYTSVALEDLRRLGARGTRLMPHG